MVPGVYVDGERAKRPDSRGVELVFIVLFEFSDQLLKTMLWNIGRLQIKKETTIYGLSLGLGFGSIFTPFLVIASSSFLTDGYYHVSLIGLGSIGIILFHAATGAYIGYGIYSGKTMKYLIIAIIIQIPFNFIVDMTRGVTSKYFVYFQLGLILFGVIFFWYVFTKIMPQILVKRKKSKSEIKPNKTK